MGGMLLGGLLFPARETDFQDGLTLEAGTKSRMTELVNMSMVLRTSLL